MEENIEKKLIDEIMKINEFVEDSKGKFIEESMFNEKMIKNRLLSRLIDILSYYKIKYDSNKLESLFDEEALETIRAKTSRYIGSKMKDLEEFLMDFSSNAEQIIKSDVDKDEKEKQNEENLRKTADELDESRNRKTNFDNLAEKLLELIKKTVVIDINDYDIITEIKSVVNRTQEEFEEVYYDLTKSIFKQASDKVEDLSYQIRSSIINDASEISQESHFY